MEEINNVTRVIGIILDIQDETGAGIIKVNLPTHMEYESQDASESKIKIDKTAFMDDSEIPDDEVTLTNYIECRPLRRDDSNGNGSSSFKPEPGKKVLVEIINQNEYYYHQINIGGPSDNRSKNHNIGRTSLTTTFKAALANAEECQNVDIISSSGNYSVLGMTDHDGISSTAISTGAMEMVLGEVPASNFSGIGMVGAGSSFYINPAYGQFSQTYAVDKYSWKMFSPSSNSSLSLKSPPSGFEKNKIIEISKLPFEGTYKTYKLKKQSHKEDIDQTYDLSVSGNLTIKSDSKGSLTTKGLKIDGDSKVEMNGDTTKITGQNITIDAKSKITLKAGGSKIVLSGSGIQASPKMNVQ